jgi:chlorobactene glucosyltransferase
MKSAIMDDMKKRHFWSRLLLWSHVLGVIGFYIFLWFRTAPSGEDEGAGHKVKPFNLAPSKTGQFVSIIVPARNEEHNIRSCVTSLLEQDYENFEVIVVDDGSTDGTLTILDDITYKHPRADRLWVLRLRDLPAGWAGKPHALHAGAQEARADWLLFTDADTWHAPGALRFSVTKAMRDGIDLLSLGTQQELPGFWNKVMMPVAYMGISMQYPAKLVNDPLSPVAIANGQYILIRRTTYDLLGGYARPDLRSTLLDDRDLARLVKENGFRLLLLDGRDLVRVHMYSGLSETWRGWRKNAFLGSRGGVVFVLLQLIGLPITSILPFLLPIVALLKGSSRRRRGVSAAEMNVAAVLELASVLAYRLWLDRKLRVPWYYGFTHPLAGTLFEGILAQSAWRVLTHKGVDWRGRRYYNGSKLPACVHSKGNPITRGGSVRRGGSRTRSGSPAT